MINRTINFAGNERMWRIKLNGVLTHKSTGKNCTYVVINFIITWNSYLDSNRNSYFWHIGKFWIGNRYSIKNWHDRLQYYLSKFQLFDDKKYKKFCSALSIKKEIQNGTVKHSTPARSLNYTRLFIKLWEHCRT